MIAKADHERIQISNEFSNRLVHKWRAMESAIMVGTRTALYDDPSLTTRLWKGNDPIRIVIDKYLQLPPQLKLFDQSGETIILNMVKQAEEGNNNFYKVGKEEDLVAVTISILRQRNITSLVVEGGAVLLESFIDAGCWDEARVISSKELIIENGIAAPVLKNHAVLKNEDLAGDNISFYSNTISS
jgi:diaminohydroxyphosphoribosylaminopyrimidine deaminase/5-amino-6-(5-phosphoribosylamino)uracil reductase